MTGKSVAVIRETRAGERRVILLPAQVQQFCAAGFEVLVETGAGAESGATDDDYRGAGAEIVDTEAAWRRSPFVIKYKAPGPHEFQYFRDDLHLGAFFHAEGDEKLIEALLRNQATAYAYEFFRTPEEIFPLAVPDSEISGKLAVLYGAYYLQSSAGGSGVLLADIPGARRPRVLVLGYGNAGAAAVRAARGLGAEVVVLGTNRERLRRFQALFPDVTCRLNSHNVREQEVPHADLIIGAILISTYDTESMIGDDLVRQMRPGSVIVDVTVGYGSGYLPTFDRQTTHADPVYERFGVLHCKIDALPGSVPLTAVAALSPLIAPYLIALGNAIYDRAPDAVSAAGQIVARGRIAHPELERHRKMREELRTGDAG